MSHLYDVRERHFPGAGTPAKAFLRNGLRMAYPSSHPRGWLCGQVRQDPHPP